MDSRALQKLIDWNAWAKRLAAVVAARAKRGGCFLRTIVDGVRIARARRRRRCGVWLIWTSADCLVVNAGRNAAALARRIIAAIVVRKESDAVLSG